MWREGKNLSTANKYFRYTQNGGKLGDMILKRPARTGCINTSGIAAYYSRGRWSSIGFQSIAQVFLGRGFYGIVPAGTAECPVCFYSSRGATRFYEV